jgi:hypothetical protein
MDNIGWICLCWFHQVVEGYALGKLFTIVIDDDIFTKLKKGLSLREDDCLTTEK